MRIKNPQLLFQALAILFSSSTMVKTTPSPLSLRRRAGVPFSGEGTFYYPNGGLGACENPLQNQDDICAVSFAQFPELPCDTCLRVTGPKGSVVVRVQDKCEGCKWGDVDLSHGMFVQIADEAAGRVAISTEVVDCSNGQALSDSSSSSNQGNANIGSARVSAPAEPPALSAAPSIASVPISQKLDSRFAASELNGGKCLSVADCPTGMCCSQHGYCGKGPQYCDIITARSSHAEEGRCETSADCPVDFCCSQYRYCGTGPAYCAWNTYLMSIFN